MPVSVRESIRSSVLRRLVEYVDRHIPNSPVNGLPSAVEA